MKQKTIHLARAAMTLLLVMLCSLGTWAGTLTGNGTADDPYLIGSDADWLTFVDWINNQNSTYRAKYYKLTADINVSTMAGTSADISFRGTFDGDGHTMTLDLTSDGNYCAPFHYCYYSITIKRLHVTGIINTSHKYAAGLVGYQYYGTLNIINCWSSVTINSSTADDYTSHGGFVGYNYADINITNSRFDGKLLGANSNGWGGFVGYWSGNHTTTINNCLYAPMEVAVGANNNYTFAYYKGVQINNSYYTEPLGTVQGTTVGTMTNAELLQALGHNWEISNGKVVPIQDIKNLTVGSLIYNTFVPYTGSEITVIPTVKDMDGNTVAAENYSVVISPSTVKDLGNYTMTVTGNANGYSGTLTHQFQVANHLSGKGTQNEPYLINSTEDWNTFAAAVAGGVTYSDKYIKLTDDITVTTMVGVYGDFPFRGTFDGAGHTITANIVSTATDDDADAQGVAPFHYVYYGKIKNLTVAGSITSASKYAAGLVGLVNGYPNFYDCVVTATITTSGDYAGGLVGNLSANGNTANSIFENCVFAGKIINTSSDDDRRAGGFYGYGSGWSYFTNCLENGAYTNLTVINPRGLGIYNNYDVNSLYYLNKIGNTGAYITDDYGCHLVTNAAPAENIYLARTIHGYDFYQPVLINNLYDVYPYNNDEEISLDYALKINSTSLVKGTDYEVVVSAAPAALGNYTITFTAMDDNAAGYTGFATRSFRVMEGESLDGYVFATEGDGDDKVYLINDESDLKRLVAYINSNHNAQGITFKQTEDITLTAPHTPIGAMVNDQYRKFHGTFDGNNKMIKNLTIDAPNENYLGLFGYTNTNAVIKNVTLANCNITGKNYTGGIVGQAYNTIIQNCHVSGTIAATRSSADFHGGITGYASNVTITGCTVTGTISTSVSNNYYGGITGNVTNTTINSCENAAAISGEGEYHGGIVGRDQDSSNKFSLCLNTGTVTGTDFVAGIAGYHYWSSNYTNCYNASPSNLKALGYYGGSDDYTGNAVRGYVIAAGSHIASISVAAEEGVVESVLTGKKYYKKGDWTLTLTPSLNDETFITYACEGGTLTNLDDVGGTHTLTITDQDVTISAYVSSKSGTDISNVTIAAISDQRWKGNDPVIPTPTVTYNEKTLVLGTDYIVEGSNNTTIREDAIVTITGINNYKGTKSANFSIVDFYGFGTENAPWQIATEEDLEALASIVNSGARNNGYYRQTADIVCHGEHTAIGCYKNGNDTYKFQGNFDGKDGETQHTIKNLTINKPDENYQGLFGYISEATVRNVVLVDVDITAKDRVGGVAGYAYDSYIYTSNVSGAIKAADGVDSYYHGGIVGYMNWYRIEGCVNTAAVTGNSTISNNFGGIAGYLSNTTVKDCFNAAEVTGTSYVGSVIGNHISGTLTNNYHTVTTTGGVGADGQTTGTDKANAEVVVKITAADGVTLTLPAEATYVWNAENLYKSGTVVTLDYALPAGKVFDHYTVNSGEISNAGIMTGEHTLTGFTEDVIITGTYANEITNLATAGAVIADIDDLTYNGSEQHPAPKVTLGLETLEAGANYTVSYSDGCTNAGEYTITVTGVGRFEGSINKTFNINKFDISGENAVVVTFTDNMYVKTGSEIHPVPTLVKCAAANNATLVLDTDYALSYSNGCIEAGNYNVTLAGKGNYTGTKTFSFAIVDVSALTVHDNTSTNEYVPVYGHYAENYNKCEMVMPASELAAMKDKNINTMRFYLSSKAEASWGDALYRVFMKEVDFTSFVSPNNSYQGTDGATIVYEGALDGTKNVMTISFTTPYYYKGGNLLIGIYEYHKGTYKRAYFYGENVSGASIQGYNGSSLDNVPVNQRGFLPKTTFWYVTPTEVPVTMNAHGIMTYASPYALDFTNVSGLTAHYASSFTTNHDNTGVLTMAQVEQVPAGEGLMLKGTASETYSVPVIDAAATLVPANLMVGLTAPTEVKTEDGGYTSFILSKLNDVIGWYPLKEDYTLKAHSAYLKLLTTDVTTARGIAMDFGDGETTSLNEELIMNNEEFTGDVWYTVDGKKLDGQPVKKGLYIHNGRKTVIK